MKTFTTSDILISKLEDQRRANLELAAADV